MTDFPAAVLKDRDGSRCCRIENGDIGTVIVKDMSRVGEGITFR